MTLRKSWQANSLTNLPRRGRFHCPTKKPHETPWGGWHRSFSRRARPSAAREGGLAYGISADHSGGTAADSHGLPRFPGPQIEISVYAAVSGVSNARLQKPPRFSDSSSWASVSRPARADLLASLPNDKVHS